MYETTGRSRFAAPWVLCCLCLTLFSVPAVFGQDADEEERLLKAVFVYNFAKFTRWPAETWATPVDPLQLCIVGKDELEPGLRRLGNETVQGRPVIVRRIGSGQPAAACQVLYVARSERGRLAEVVAQVRGEPVLTVSELPGFVESGGIIRIYRRQDRIRFTVNLPAARNSALALSARLLDLADVLDEEGAR